MQTVVITDTVTDLSLYSVTVGHADALEVFRRYVRPDGRRSTTVDLSGVWPREAHPSGAV